MTLWRVGLVILASCAQSTQPADLSPERALTDLSDMERGLLCEELVEFRPMEWLDGGVICVSTGISIPLPSGEGCVVQLRESFREGCEWTVGEERECQSALFADGYDLCLETRPLECERPDSCPIVRLPHSLE